MEKRQSSWNVVKTFDDPESSLVVQVSAAPLGRRNNYSIMIGRKRDDGYVLPHIGILRDPQNNTRVQLQTDYAAVLGRLILMAQDYVLTRMTQEFESWIDEKQRYERINSPGRTQQTMRPGKTIRDKGKRGKTEKE